MEQVSIAVVASLHGLFVFFKAFQQRNVAYLHYWWVVPTSYAMSAVDVTVMSAVAIRAVHAQSWTAVIPLAAALGTGSCLGALGAMWAHTRLAKYVENRNGKNSRRTLFVQQGRGREGNDHHGIRGLAYSGEDPVQYSRNAAFLASTVLDFEGRRPVRSEADREG